MSNYHALDTSHDGGTIRVAFHIVIKDEKNIIGYSIRSALAEDAGVDKTSVVPWIDEKEQILLTNGELYEYVHPFKTNKDIIELVKRDSIGSKYSSITSMVQEAIRQKYMYWRFNGDVI